MVIYKLMLRSCNILTRIIVPNYTSRDEIVSILSDVGEFVVCVDNRISELFTFLKDHLPYSLPATTAKRPRVKPAAARGTTNYINNVLNNNKINKNCTRGNDPLVAARVLVKGCILEPHLEINAEIFTI